MKTIIFYKDIERIYSVYANSLDDVRNNPLNYFPEYTENMIITEKEFQYPIQDENGLREMTKEEKVRQGIEVQLEEGEILKNKKIIKFDRPSKYHQWINNKWIINLDEIKKIKRNELKAIRDEKVHSDIEVHGYIFQVRVEDKEHFDDVERAVTRGYKKPTDKRTWILADNSLKEFTYEELQQVIDEKGKRKDEIFAKFGALSIKLEACKSVEEIENIKWED